MVWVTGNGQVESFIDYIRHPMLSSIVRIVLFKINLRAISVEFIISES